MSAKAKALQVMAVIGISAITYTVYHSASRNDIKPDPAPILLKSINAKKERKAVKVEAVTDTKSKDNIPGYCDPDQAAR
jgi:hypothetical protein